MATMGIDLGTPSAAATVRREVRPAPGHRTVPRVSSEQLFRPCPPQDIPFDTTLEAAETCGVIGQRRAEEAIELGVAVRREGFHLFALGPQGIGKRTLVRQILDREARRSSPPNDVCYVANLVDARRPRALVLPPGQGARLRSEMERAVAELRVGMRAAFESEEYLTRKHQLVKAFNERQEAAFTEVQERVRKRGVGLMKTDSGVVLAPLSEGEMVEATEFEKLPQEEQSRIHEEMKAAGEEVMVLLRQLHETQRQHGAALKALERETSRSVARRVMDGVRQRFSDLPAVLEYLASTESDVVDHADDFLQVSAEGLEAALRQAIHHDPADGGSFHRYQVNVLVDHGATAALPVVYEENPTHPNLVGRIDHVSQFGTLVTNFTLIRPGALHRAIGGYLILDAIEVLRHPFAWEALKRTMRTRQIRTEPLAEMLGLTSTVSLEPEPLPLGDTKIVLLGERTLYYLLSALDPDFPELFKVMVDFEDEMDRGPEAHATYATLLANLLRGEGLRPMDRDAVARAIEEAARLAGDAEKLSLHMRAMVDLLAEADFCAAREGHQTITAEDVQRAVDEKRQRAGRIRDRMLEEIRRGSVLIDVAGEQIGQVNGLSVFHLGEQWFGHPTRITARVHMGKGEVVDIEREVELGGPIHSKGVLILSGFLGSRYAPGIPLSLSASLVFEQSYASVEGDSASLAELCALLSALAQAPVRQCLAVTGSVNQHGQVQPIGGVNEKIEGYFDVCRDRELTGRQGVVIPRSNVKNLMLRRDVVEAIDGGRFHVYAVEHVDEALQLLTALPAGSPDEDGHFPTDTVNGRVASRLAALAEQARSFSSRGTA